MEFHELQFEAATPNVSQIKSMGNLVGKVLLREMYRSAVPILNRRYPAVTVRTHAEIHLGTLLQKATRMQVLSGVWIGRSCVDYFIPGVAGEKLEGKQMKGLVIEVNGPIHNHELKMRKDANRVAMLSALGIGLIEMENADLHHPANQRIIGAISSLPRVESRPRQRLWQTVHAWTLMANGFFHFGGFDDAL